jgi:ATP-binding cassette subfamily C protein
MWQNATILAVLIILFATMLLGYDIFFKGRVKKYGEEGNKASNLTLKGIHEGMEGFKEIRVLGKEKYFYHAVDREVKKQALYDSKYQFLATIPRSLIELLMILFIVLIVIVAITTDQDLKMLMPTLGLFSIASLRLFPFISTFANILIELRHSHDSIARLYNDVYKFRQKKHVGIINFEKEEGLVFQDIQFDNVSFGYPETSAKILNKVSFKIKSGESIGIIGSSGSGKTTLIDLLTGLLSPSSGTIYYNGLPIIENLAQWRSQVSYIPQNIFLLDSTLKSNISWEPESQVDNDKIMKAIEQAQLSDLVKGLPNGLDTTLGERGMRVSGGQRQRIALARAFYNDRSVIIMDESTSALDNETEMEISNEIEMLKGSKTLIVIAHRLTTLKNCDRIYRLKDGRIIDTVTT